MPTLHSAASYILILAIVIAGCSRAPALDDTKTATGGSNTAAAADPVAAPLKEFGETLLWADPLRTCEPGQVTRIHWSKEAVAAGPARIELGDTDPGVFARIGDAGEKLSGAWASPGGVVVLRGEDGQVRARLTFKGPENCATE